MIPASVRDKGKKRNIFDKVTEIEEILYNSLPELKGDRKLLIYMLCHCRRYFEGKLYYGRRSIGDNIHRQRPLTINERVIYDLLIRHNLNPSTAYRWFLYTRIPSDLKEKMMSDRISARQALTISANRKKTKDSKLGILMMEEIGECIRRL
jgi:hypothetical protein